MTFRLVFKNIFVVTGLLLPFWLGQQRAEAQGIRIVDCNGRTRALHKTEVPIQYLVRIRVFSGAGSPAVGSVVVLKSAGGYVESAVSEDGIAEFPTLKPGVWLMGANTRGLYYSEIDLEDDEPGFWTRNGDAVAVAVLAGVAVTGAIIINNATDSDSSSDAGGGDGNPPGDCQTCNPDGEPPSIPPFRW